MFSKIYVNFLAKYMESFIRKVANWNAANGSWLTCRAAFLLMASGGLDLLMLAPLVGLLVRREPTVKETVGESISTIIRFPAIAHVNIVYVGRSVCVSNVLLCSKFFPVTGQVYIPLSFLFVYHSFLYFSSVCSRRSWVDVTHSSILSRLTCTWALLCTYTYMQYRMYRVDYLKTKCWLLAALHVLSFPIRFL